METKIKNNLDEMVQEATQKRQAVGMEILPQDYETIAREMMKLETDEGDAMRQEAYDLFFDRANEMWRQIKEAKKDTSFPRNLNKTQLFLVVSEKRYDTQQKWFRSKSEKRMDELAEATFFWDAFVETLENSVPTTD